MRSNFAVALVAALLSRHASAQLVARQTDSAPGSGTTPAPTPAPAHGTPAAGHPTAVSDCHLHGTEVFCMWGATEFEVKTPAPTRTQDLPASFTGCHAHGAATFCLGPNGGDVQIVPHGAAEDEGHNHESDADASGGTGPNCHFHAGIEHCVDALGQAVESTCQRVTRDYNMPLRVGLLFVIMATSGIGVFAPILLIRYWPARTHKIFLVLKQFGTGVIISTAFVHLFTHASLMFGNECLGELNYESTTAAVVMGGIFLSFLVEYLGKRVVLARQARSPDLKSWASPTTVTVLVLECGIIFHSILIGITLVVAGDSFFLTLFVVILFHQMFEGIALGSRIANLGSQGAAKEKPQRGGDGLSLAGETTPGSAGSMESLKTPHFSLARKLALAFPFALVTPIGMAIGIGVLQSFNGNDRSTIIAIATLDAVSAGILIWVGVVEMWAEDWMVEGAELLSASALTTVLAGLGLVSGMVIMSVLGKWT